MDYNFISSTPLFCGMDVEETEGILSCLSVAAKTYEKKETVFHMGDTIASMGLVLSGAVNIVKHDVWGNQMILDHVQKGQVFGETYACLEGERLMAEVVAVEKTDILFLEAGRVIRTCSAGCSFHSRLIHNLIDILARRNLTLTSKIDHITPRLIRDRVLSYLSSQAVRAGACSFQIPFNRQQLADYLSVDRSALSNELSKLEKEGILTFKKNDFVLHI